MVFVWIGIITIVVTAVVWLVLQQRGVLSGIGEHRRLPPEERTVFNLEVGDIVQYMGADWVVEGRLAYNVGDYIWYEYLLQDGERISWLSVDEDDRVEVALLEPTNQLELSGEPPKQLTFADETYRCLESGIADMNRTGTTLHRTAERCRYFDYEGSDNKVLSIEEWDGRIEVTVGQRINPRMLTLLPGTGQRVYGG
ncbi:MULTISPECIES: DUF4178 domain-containing protein [unclassified Coleofasciculus]|uniref:DUF4178 domain-containing protein n=1 Tax=unclassified Coleofasciculus TaxID=2692782 RepID=UPI00188139AD|nr:MULTISPECIES: DUF4178 domain-containing protein [unclassified Coleofasciculus]MBE9126098.1 DUF4178 domain-containing protein [Coleofasciculus sp. LEGE 07081]MBE9147547.1 DUF4178 domain-containing protein [Coleofasciculus sp. LEGE 07092]